MDKVDHRQREQWTAVHEIQKRDFRAAFLAGTGFGKTRVVVTSIIMWHSNNDDRVLILVPFEHLKTRFQDEFCKVLGEEMGAKFVEDHVEMHCYASVKNNPLQLESSFPFKSTPSPALLLTRGACSAVCSQRHEEQ